MEKKESPKPENNLLPRIPGFSARVFGIIKFVLGVCLLPFVYSVSVSFLNEFSVIERVIQNHLWWGLISFLIIYLFIWEPGIIYVRGQKLVELIFVFFKPLVRVAPYLLPIYTIVSFIAYWILSFICKNSTGLIHYFIFLFGFSMGLHLVFSAKSIRAKQTGLLKANYIFGFSLIYIINLILLAFFLNFIFEKFSVVNFLNNSFQLAKGIFSGVFKQLFL